MNSLLGSVAETVVESPYREYSSLGMDLFSNLIITSELHLNEAIQSSSDVALFAACNVGMSIAIIPLAPLDVIFRIAYAALALVACIFVPNKKDFFNKHVLNYGLKEGMLSLAVIPLCLVNIITFGGLAYLMSRKVSQQRELLHQQQQQQQQILNQIQQHQHQQQQILNQIQQQQQQQQILNQIQQHQWIVQQNTARKPQSNERPMKTYGTFVST